MENAVDASTVATFIDLDPWTVLGLIVLGVFGGMLSGFIGSGGAFVLTPGMMSMGVEGPVAVASNMAHKFPKAIVGAWKRRKLGHVDVKLGLVMAGSAILGVQVGIIIQKLVLDTWGKAGSNLYISVVFVVVLFVVGGYMLRDGRRAAKMGMDDTTSALAKKIQAIEIPPMVHFKQANARVSLWVTAPLGFATGLLAATIAVGGFIGVPSMIYVMGVPAFVASGSELVIAFVMGMTGAFTYALGGFVDLRLTVLLLAGSLIGVQVGAIATSYVKQYMIKIVTGVVMLLAGVSRAMVVPTYLSDLDVISIGDGLHDGLTTASLVILFCTLGVTGLIITLLMVRAKRESPLGSEGRPAAA